MTVTTKTAAGAANQMTATRVPWQLKFTALAFIWGSSFLLVKVGLRSLAPLQISGWPGLVLHQTLPGQGGFRRAYPSRRPEGDLRRPDAGRPDDLVADPAQLPVPGRACSLHVNTSGGSVLVPLLAVLALGVFGTGIAMSFQYDVVRQAGPTVGSSVTYLILVVSVALGVLVLGERLVWPQFVGAAVVLGAPVMIGRSKH